MAMMRAALAISEAAEPALGGLDALLGAVGHDQGDHGAHGGQMKKPTMAMTSAAVAELSVGGPAG